MSRENNPNGGFLAALESDLQNLRDRGLWREIREVHSPQATRLVMEGQNLLNFSSNDYLGLANDKRLKTAAVQALERYGAGSGASRLICGSLRPHQDLEERLAEFKGVQAALAFSSGYATALGTIGALAEKDDVVVLDKLVHASIVDAARLSGAKLRVFAHNDLNELEAILRWTDTRVSAGAGARKRRVLIVTESVFSMDGDVAPLKQIVELKDRHGAWLMLDEAHAIGVLGRRGRGLADALGIAERVEVQMGTLGKALGSAGGYVSGPGALRDLLVNRARAFIYSTAPIPASAAAAKAAVDILDSEEGQQRMDSLWERVKDTREGMASLGWLAPEATSAILPLIVGEESMAMKMSAALRRAGILLPAIRYPTVARGAARLRLTLTAAHTPEDVVTLLRGLRGVKE